MNTKPEPIPDQGQSSIEKTAFLVAEVGFLSALGFWGGPAWVGIAVPVILVEIFCGSQTRSLGMLMPAGLWLVLCRFTGNRELFFPYAMYVTAFVVSRLWEKPHCGICGWTFQWMPISFNPLVSGREHSVLLLREPSQLELSLLWVCSVGKDEPWLVPMCWFDSRFAVGVCRSCLVIVNYLLPAAQYPAEGKDEANYCRQDDP